MALIFTPSTDPGSAGLKHNEASRQGLSALFDQFDHIFSKLRETGDWVILHRKRPLDVPQAEGATPSVILKTIK